MNQTETTAQILNDLKQKAKKYMEVTCEYMDSLDYSENQVLQLKMDHQEMMTANNWVSWTQHAYNYFAYRTFTSLSWNKMQKLISILRIMLKQKWMKSQWMLVSFPFIWIHKINYDIDGVVKYYWNFFE